MHNVRTSIRNEQEPFPVLEQKEIWKINGQAISKEMFQALKTAWKINTPIAQKQIEYDKVYTITFFERDNYHAIVYSIF